MQLPSVLGTTRPATNVVVHCLARLALGDRTPAEQGVGRVRHRAQEPSIEGERPREDAVAAHPELGARRIPRVRGPTAGEPQEIGTEQRLLRAVELGGRQRPGGEQQVALSVVVDGQESRARCLWCDKHRRELRVPAVVPGSLVRVHEERPLGQRGVTIHDEPKVGARVAALVRQQVGHDQAWHGRPREPSDVLFVPREHREA
eukprot:3389592-Prymnesium_polylepis.2